MTTLDNILSLIDTPAGDTYNHERDGQRLATQRTELFALMSDGQWRTHAEMARHIRGSETGIAARLRELRRPRFGGHLVERRHVERGLYEYRLTPADSTP